MVKIYVRKYQGKIDNGEIIYAEAVALVRIEVPERWREDVIARLHE